MNPKCHDKCLYKREAEVVDYIHRGEGDMKTEQK